MLGTTRSTELMAAVEDGIKTDRIHLAKDRAGEGSANKQLVTGTCHEHEKKVDGCRRALFGVSTALSR